MYDKAFSMSEEPKFGTHVGVAPMPLTAQVSNLRMQLDAQDRMIRELVERIAKLEHEASPQRLDELFGQQAAALR